MTEGDPDARAVSRATVQTLPTLSEQVDPVIQALFKVTLDLASCAGTRLEPAPENRIADAIDAIDQVIIDLRRIAHEALPPGPSTLPALPPHETSGAGMEPLAPSTAGQSGTDHLYHPIYVS